MFMVNDKGSSWAYGSPNFGSSLRPGAKCNFFMLPVCALVLAFITGCMQMLATQMITRIKYLKSGII